MFYWCYPSRDDQELVLDDEWNKAVGRIPPMVATQLKRGARLGNEPKSMDSMALNLDFELR
jgi:hypothetical protein